MRGQRITYNRLDAVYDTLELRGVEQAKIECAKAHFASINNGSVTYEVVSTCEQLLELVSWIKFFQPILNSRIFLLPFRVEVSSSVGSILSYSLIQHSISCVTLSKKPLTNRPFRGTI